MYKNVNQILCSRIKWEKYVYTVTQTPDLRYLSIVAQMNINH